MVKLTKFLASNMFLCLSFKEKHPGTFTLLHFHWIKYHSKVVSTELKTHTKKYIRKDINAAPLKL